MATTPSPSPADRVAEAERQARAADQAVAAASSARLAEIMKLSPREQLRALGDPALVTADRVRLRQSLEARLPIGRMPRCIIPRAPNLRKLASRGLQLVLSAPGLIALSVGGAWLGLATGNTRPLAIMTERGMSGIPLPDGSMIVVTLVPGVVYPVLGHQGNETVLGLWQMRTGYLPFRVPASTVRPYRWITSDGTRPPGWLSCPTGPDRPATWSLSTLPLTMAGTARARQETAKERQLNR